MVVALQLNPSSILHIFGRMRNNVVQAEFADVLLRITYTGDIYYVVTQVVGGSLQKEDLEIISETILKELYECEDHNWKETIWFGVKPK